MQALLPGTSAEKRQMLPLNILTEDDFHSGSINKLSQPGLPGSLSCTRSKPVFLPDQLLW